MRFQKILASLLSLLPLFLSAQQTATVYGRVTDASDGQPVELVSVFIKGSGKAVSTDESGKFATQIPANQRVTLSFKRVAYQETSADILALQPGARYALDLTMSPIGANLEVVISERRLDDGGMVKEKNIRELKMLPSTTGNLESVLPHIALGTNTGTGGELSSQYQVRGGNYDENLVYVNDFEIYRPQLIRAGQQEGPDFSEY